MRIAFSKIVVSKCKQRSIPVYVNFARMRSGKWIPCWSSRFFGASSLYQAALLRREWLKELRGVHPRTSKAIRTFWNEHSVRTIRVL